MSRIKGIVKEPIVLFFLLGILLFALYTLVAGGLDRSEKTIVVSSEQVEMMKQTFTQTWNRPPTESELEGLVDNFIMDEVFFREAVAMGLDKSDPAVKRRLRQLIELMIDDFATVYPSETQLQTYLANNKEKFMEDPQISFRHLYFSENQMKDAEAQLDNLRNGRPIDQSRIGSLAMIPREFNRETLSGLQRVFGEQFAIQLFELEEGTWQGPVLSPYGWHLVYINELVPGYVPELNEIWDVVEREWSVEQKSVKKEEQYEVIKSRYDIELKGGGYTNVSDANEIQ